MKGQLNRQISLAKHIIDGSITIDSVKEFKGMLQVFPKDPALHRAYADLLARKKEHDLATRCYARAANLFIQAGMMLQAIMCKALEWQINKPSPAKAEHFHDNLHKGEYHETPAKQFFDRLSNIELPAVIESMQQIRLNAGEAFKKFGDPEDALYFVVSGKLKATTYQPLQKNKSDHRKTTVYLSENDFFGAIYPFKEEKFSQAYVEAFTPLELVKIPKKRLMRLCAKHAKIELCLIDLLKTRSGQEDREFLRRVRKAERHALPLRMNLKIWPDKSGHQTLVLDGFSKDISVDGMCIILDAKYTNIPAVYKSIKNARIEICLPGGALTISVFGAIVWNKQVVFENDKTVALGIQFERMSPKLSGMLVVFADILCSGA